MTNELLTLLFLIAYMLCAIGCYKLGKAWLQTFLVLSYIITLSITNKFFDLFGLTATAGIITYSGIFLATDMMTERYGKAAGFQTVRIGFVMSALYVLATQVNLLFEPLSFAAGMSAAMDEVFGGTVRVMIAGFSVYLIAQHFDVWLYHFIHKKTGEKYLWLRNCASTMASQTIDSVLFFTFAFYGTLSNSDFLAILLTGIALKLVIALLDTPFIYLARRIKPLDIQK